jgi:hypothetical protein
LVSKNRLLDLFNEIQPNLIRYPAIDPISFSQAVDRFANQSEPPTEIP